jgi:hypothetical protein
MNTRLFLRAGCLVALAALAEPGLQANPLKDPKRVVSERSVDLSPLFRWWNKREETRPLTAWVHLQGEIVGTNAWGWIVEAQVEETGQPGKNPAPKGANGHPPRILLKTPPLTDRAEFEQLNAQLKALEAEHTELANEENQAKRIAANNSKMRVRGRGAAQQTGSCGRSRTWPSRTGNPSISRSRSLKRSWRSIRIPTITPLIASPWTWGRHTTASGSMTMVW